MLDTQVLSLGREDPLEEGMATNSSIPARRIPQTEEPGGLQSTGPQRVRHDWVIEHIIQLLPALCPQGRGKSNSLERRTACERNHDSKPGLLHPAPTLWTSALYLNICSLGISRHSNFRGHLAPNVQVGWPRLALCLGKRDGRAASP